MTNEEEIDIINNLIERRQKALNSGNEAECKDIEKMFKSEGFEIKDDDGVTIVKKAKLKDTI